jgi:hypothetical protein
MSDLIDRYVHQVGLYVRPQERAEIEAELRSQIQDQLEDRYGATPTATDIATLLKQFGDPKLMAASYGGEQYLVGPALYPWMMMVLRLGLPLLPTVVVIANVLGAILSSEGTNLLGLLVGSLFTAIQAALIFVAIVVLIFAILQHSGEELPKAKNNFDPSSLPLVDDPGAVERSESSIAIAVATLFAIAILYFIQVGGITLRFDLNNRGEVLPAPVLWLVVWLLTQIVTIVLNIVALLHQRWTVATMLAQILTHLGGLIALYFAVFMPILERITQTNPDLATRLPIAQVPWVLTLSLAIIIMLVNGSKLIRLWQYQQAHTA